LSITEKKEAQMVFYTASVSPQTGHLQLNSKKMDWRCTVITPRNIHENKTAKKTGIPFSLTAKDPEPVEK
jgi:hypothetical protein